MTADTVAYVLVGFFGVFTIYNMVISRMHWKAIREFQVASAAYLSGSQALGDEHYKLGMEHKAKAELWDFLPF